MQNALPSTLSKRQAEIAAMIVSGRSTREIAFALTLSPRTVETHIAAIYDKYGVTTRAELIIAVLGPTAREEPGAIGQRPSRTNLPLVHAGLVGRGADISTVKRLVRDRRLVTIVGAGGIGKTRTALAVAAEALDDFPFGVWFVELAAVAPGSSPAHALARVLGLRLPPQVDPTDALVAHLEDRPMLLVFDNCEHLIDEAAIVIDALLQRCGEVRILATSREPLRITAEQTYRLPSLDVPRPDLDGRLDVAAGAAYSAIALFARRAIAVDDEFVLTGDNVASIAQICRRLDGIPLALELAAARLNVLSLPALASSLDAHLPVLVAADRVAPPRHKTMRALIDWSYDLIDPQERRLFESLSIVRGGCARAEARALYGDDLVDEIGILDLLSSLVDKSLVIADRTTSEPRYRLLQTFQAYGAQKLGTRGELSAVAHRHAIAYTALAERLDDEYDVAPDTAWFARAESEIGNFESALDWTLRAGHDVALGQRLAGALRPIWTIAEGGRRWIELARDSVDERTPLAIAARLDFADMMFRSRAGELEATVAACRRLQAVYAELGDSLRAAMAAQYLASTLITLDRTDEAEPLLANVLEAARTQRRSMLVAAALQSAARLRFARGDLRGGRSALAEALALYDAVGAERHAVNIGGMLAEAEFRAGNVEHAIELAAKSLATLRRLGWTIFVVQYLANLAAYALALDRWAEAQAYAREALAFARGQRDSRGVLFLLQHLAAAAMLACDAQRPARSTAVGVARVLGYVDACLARTDSLREHTEQQEDDRVRARLATELSRDELTAHLAEGALLTSDQARDLALSLSN